MIAEPLQSINAIAGKEARFQARLAALPEPEIAWYKDGKQIVQAGAKLTSKYRFYFQTQAHSHTRGLIISPVEPSDSGVYELRAWNRFGKVACSALLTVKGKEHIPREFLYASV